MKKKSGKDLAKKKVASASGVQESGVKKKRKVVPSVSKKM